MLLDRSDRGSGDPSLLMTNLPHREWIQRQAYMMGRNLIGYEVQKVLRRWIGSSSSSTQERSA